MKRFFICLLSVLMMIVIFALLFNPQRYIVVCLNGLSLWALNVLPALLPFVFLSLLISEMNFSYILIKKMSIPSRILFGTNGYGFFVHFMSVISGYPVGVKLISELYKQGKITKDESSQFSLFSSTAGPMFVVGTVGSIMFSSEKIGLILFISHIISALLNAIIFRKTAVYRPIPPLIDKKRENNILFDCAFNSAISSLVVGTFISVFFVLSAILEDFKILYPFEKIINLIFNDINLSRGFLKGLIECTSGCRLISQTHNKLAVPLCCSLVSFGGISVIIQSVAFLKEANGNVKKFLFSKMLMMINSFLICFVLCNIFKIS